MRRIFALSTLIVAMAFASSAFAQSTDIEALAGLQFNFGNPGARSLGMGGAFLGLADDASAAEANPAGLTILRRPEISIEGRNYETVQTFNVGGTFPDLTSQDFNFFSRNAEVSFGSVVVPFGAVTLAAYYHQPVRFHNDLVNIFGETDSRGNFNVIPITFFLGPNGPTTATDCANLGAPACLQYNLFPFFTNADVDLKTYGVAGAWKMGTLSLGVGVRYQKFTESASTFRTDFDLNPLNQVSQVSDGNDTTFTGGFKWAPNDRFSVGGVYKQGASFDAPLFFEDTETPITQIGKVKFKIPNSAGVGISFRPIPVLTLNADAVRVGYKSLTSGFQTVLDAPNSGYKSRDVTEYHAGAEYFFTTKIPFAIRGGYWRDPAHAITFTGPLNTPSAVSARILYPPRKDQEHWTVGAGIAFPKFQLDAAYDTSDTFKVGSVSAVFRF